MVFLGNLLAADPWGVEKPPASAGFVFLAGFAGAVGSRLVVLLTGFAGAPPCTRPSGAAAHP